MNHTYISLSSYAQKQGVCIATASEWIREGLVPGVRKVPGKYSKYAYQIPEDAVPLRPKRGRKRARATICNPADGKKSSKSKHGYTQREISLFIRRHAGNMSYAQISRALDIPILEIRRIYDHLHEAYGI